jgi:hypothetical protein
MGVSSTTLRGSLTPARPFAGHAAKSPRGSKSDGACAGGVEGGRVSEGDDSVRAAPQGLVAARGVISG